MNLTYRQSKDDDFLPLKGIKIIKMKLKGGKLKFFKKKRVKIEEKRPIGPANLLNKRGKIKINK